MGGSTSTPVHSGFNCKFLYESERGQATYQTDVGENQYRRLPHNIINDRQRQLWTKRGKFLILGDRVKIVIHNFILDNVRRGSPLGFPGDPSWNKALLEQIKRVERRCTIQHVDKWVRNHVWIQRRHCNFTGQRNNEEPWPVEPAKEELIRKGDTRWPFGCHHLYNSGRGTFYRVNFSIRQYPRLPNNYVGHHSRSHYERMYGQRSLPASKSSKYELRSTTDNDTGKGGRKTRSSKPFHFPIGDTIKLIIHNFLLENVNRGEPHGVPGDVTWNRAVLEQIRVEFPIVTEADVARWVQKHCWIWLKHNQFTEQR